MTEIIPGPADILYSKLSIIRCCTGCLNNINYLVFRHGNRPLTQDFIAAHAWPTSPTSLKITSSTWSSFRRCWPCSSNSTKSAAEGSSASSIR